MNGTGWTGDGTWEDILWMTHQATTIDAAATVILSTISLIIDCVEEGTISFPWSSGVGGEVRGRAGAGSAGGEEEGVALELATDREDEGYELDVVIWEGSLALADVIQEGTQEEDIGKSWEGNEWMRLLGSRNPMKNQNFPNMNF